jgi:hypothetical protein
MPAGLERRRRSTEMTMIRCSLYALTLGAMLVGTAHAQGSQERQPSPERRAAFEALHRACAKDLQSLCPGKERREAMMCLRQNLDRASAGCKSAVAKLPPRQE